MTVNEFTKPQPLSDTVREFVILTPVFDIRFFIPDFDKERDLGTCHEVITMQLCSFSIHK